MSLTTSQEILDLWAKNESPEAKEERLAINSLRRDVETAQESIQDAIGRYRKRKLRARSKAKANAADVFSELDQYSSMEDIRNAYGYEVITEHEMDRLMNLWELREQTYRREGPYTDRVIEMLELASQGAQVLHNRSVELAKSYNVRLEVLSSFTGNPGTIVKEAAKKVEKTYITGIAQDKKIARFALVGLEDVPGVAYKLFSVLAKGKINVDMIIQSLGRDEMKDIVFTVAEKDVMDCAKLLDANKDTLSFDHMDINTGVAKVSIVGAGMLENVGIAAKMFEALYQQHINIHMISTSEVKISVLIDKDDSDRAVRVLHNQFFQ